MRDMSQDAESEALVVAGGRLYSTLKTATLACLDHSTGPPYQQLSLPRSLVATAADRRASDRVLCRAWWSGSRLGVESWPATRQDHACCGRKLHHQHAGTRKTAGHRPEFSRHEKYDERPLSFAKCERRARKPNTTARFVFLQSLRIESRPPKTEYDV